MIICPLCSKIISVQVDPEVELAEGRCEENFIIPGYSFPVGCFVQTDIDDINVLTGYQLNLFHTNEMTVETKMFGFDSFKADEHGPPSTRLYHLYENIKEDDNDRVAGPDLIMDLELWTPIEEAVSTFKRLLKLKAFL